MRWKLFTLMLLVGPMALAGPIYKWVDENGVIHYSDQPHENAQQIHLGAPQTYKATQYAQPQGLGLRRAAALLQVRGHLAHGPTGVSRRRCGVGECRGGSAAEPGQPDLCDARRTGGCGSAHERPAVLTRRGARRTLGRGADSRCRRQDGLRILGSGHVFRAPALGTGSVQSEQPCQPAHGPDPASALAGRHGRPRHGR